jgi:hypothetical protein
MMPPVMPSAVSGVPRIVLRMEGMTLLVTAVVLYGRTGDSWWVFAILFLAPDISFLGYLGGPRMGAIAYNAAHTLIGPLLLATAGILLPAHILLQLALIWVGAYRFRPPARLRAQICGGFRIHTSQPPATPRSRRPAPRYLGRLTASDGG